MNDSPLVRVSSQLASATIGSIGHTAGQPGGGSSAAKKDQKDSHPGAKKSPHSFADVSLSFASEQDRTTRKALDLQSFADFIVLHNLSTRVHVVPHYHGPKLIKLASLLADSPN